MQIHHLGNLLWLWAPIKILYVKIVDVGQGRQLNDLCISIFTQKSYCHRSFNMWCLPAIVASQKSTPSRDTTCASNPLNPNLFQVSTIPTYGLSKIPQVSCQRCKKAIKIASKYVRSFSVRENSALYELGWQRIKAIDCIIKVFILRGNITWRSLALRDWAYKQISAWQPLLPSAKGLSFTFMYLLLCKVSKFSFYSFLFSLLASIMWWGKI